MFRLSIVIVIVDFTDASTITEGDIDHIGPHNIRRSSKEKNLKGRKCKTTFHFSHCDQKILSSLRQ